MGLLAHNWRNCEILSPARCLKPYLWKSRSDGGNKPRKNMRPSSKYGRRPPLASCRENSLTDNSKSLSFQSYQILTIQSCGRCIQSLVRFMQPILDLTSQATGWPLTLITGGPEPAHGGRLNVIRYKLIH